tara:strand:+ start:7233 stop:7961 length:729 start_codon:yes stop_codon:yes gene_type:complete
LPRCATVVHTSCSVARGANAVQSPKKARKSRRLNLLDILIPTAVHDADLLPDCLESIDRHTSVPYRVTVLIDGGQREDFAKAEAFLAAQDFEWRLLHERQPVYLNKSICELISDLHHPLVALVMPNCRITDESWFGKMRMPLDKDWRAAMVDSVVNTKAATGVPILRPRKNPHQGACGLMLFRSKFLKHNPPSGDVEPTQFLHDRAYAEGMNVWHSGAVKYNEVQHRKHRLWPSSSAHTTSE